MRLTVCRSSQLCLESLSRRSYITLFFPGTFPDVHFSVFSLMICAKWQQLLIYFWQNIIIFQRTNREHTPCVSIRRSVHFLTRPFPRSPFNALLYHRIGFRLKRIFRRRDRSSRSLCIGSSDYSLGQKFVRRFVGCFISTVIAELYVLMSLVSSGRLANSRGLDSRHTVDLISLSIRRAEFYTIDVI